MFNYSRRSKRVRQRRPSILFRIVKIVVVTTVVVVAWVAMNLPVLGEYVAGRQKRDKVRAQVAKLQEEIELRKIEKEQLLDRGFGDEAVARERFQLIKPGEKIVFLEERPKD